MMSRLPTCVLRLPHRILIAAVFAAVLGSACSRVPDGRSAPLSSPPASLGEIPAASLNFRYEADVPPPAAATPQTQERNTAVQADFDQNRPQEILDRTIASPDAKRIAAVYYRIGDAEAEYRIDMYTPDGRPLRKVSPDSMAVHFPDTVVWSPTSTNIAFVGMLRAAGGPTSETGDGQAAPTPPVNPDSNGAPAGTPAEADGAAAASPTPAPAASVLTFRTEQIYLAGADGENLKPLTQNEGLIYFYYVWSPNGTVLAALAATAREWQEAQARADAAGEILVPSGRPRIIEKTGRERRLDDSATSVQPVWSPDSTKVAAAFGKQIRIYDASGAAPTQAAIPIRNGLLISSAAYDRQQAATLGQQQVTPSPPDAAGSPAADQSAPPTTLPDETTLVSFNPIVELRWPADDTLYFQTAYVKRMKNEADSATSFARWHRVVFTPQAPATD